MTDQPVRFDPQSADNALMRLTKFSDYALRVLMYVAARNGAKATVSEVADAYGISKSHVKKVVRHLIAAEWLDGIRGRSGGFTLAVAPETIRLGDVLRRCEPDFNLVTCMEPNGQCVISATCRLPALSDRAVQAFLAVYDSYTLADLLLPESAFFPADGPLGRFDRGRVRRTKSGKQ